MLAQKLRYLEIFKAFATVNCSFDAKIKRHLDSGTNEPLLLVVRESLQLPAQMPSGYVVNFLARGVTSKAKTGAHSAVNQEHWVCDGLGGHSAE